MILPVTGIYAALLAMLAIVLATRVVLLRRGLRVGLGTGGHDALARAIRAHGNLVEYAPLALLLLLIIESGGGNRWLVHGLGASLLLGRLLHAWGLSGHAGKSFGRFYGTGLTWLVIIVSAVVMLASLLY